VQLRFLADQGKQFFAAEMQLTTSKAFVFDEWQWPISPSSQATASNLKKTNKLADIVQTTLESTSTLCAGNGRVTFQLEEIVEIDFLKKCFKCENRLII
jgi:hypothetical protein